MQRLIICIPEIMFHALYSSLICSVSIDRFRLSNSSPVMIGSDLPSLQILDLWHEPAQLQQNMLHPPVAAHFKVPGQPQQNDSAIPTSIVRRNNVKSDFFILFYVGPGCVLTFNSIERHIQLQLYIFSLIFSFIVYKATSPIFKELFRR